MCGKSQSFGCIDTDEKAAREPWPTGDSHCVQRCCRDSGSCQCLSNDRLDRQHVLAAGQFRKNTAKPTVQLDLGRHDIGMDDVAIFDHRSCSLVTAGFNCQDFGHRIPRWLPFQATRGARKA